MDPPLFLPKRSILTASFIDIEAAGAAVAFQEEYNAFEICSIGCGVA